MDNQDAYIRHTLNFSPTKQTHIFSKAQRFIKRKRVITEAFYNLPSTISKQTTSFGFGDKQPYPNSKGQSPPPGSYQPVSQFNKKNFSNITSMAPGRDKIAFGSFIWDTLKKNKDKPSPDKYNIPVLRSRKGGKMAQRINTEPDLREKMTIPGPGSYKLECTQMKKGNYILSTYKNNFSTKIFKKSKIPSIRHHHLSADVDCISPHIQNNIQEKTIGKYPVSKYKNITINIFSKSKRQGMEERHQLQNPGCKYRKFSEFGSYI